MAIIGRLFPFTLLLAALLQAPSFIAAQQPHRNVIIFVADGLRRDSVNAQDMPTFLHLRSAGVDFRNSHAAFPTFTTANASVIATGHGLGDTGDYSNTIWPGLALSPPASTSEGTIVPFLENDELLADMNSTFHGNYLGERTLLSAAQDHGYNVAALGKIGPTGIQHIEAVGWNEYGSLSDQDAIILDDATGTPAGLPIPPDIAKAIVEADLIPDAPLRSNGFSETSQGNNGFSGDAQNPGTLTADVVQEQWLVDVATRVVLPKFAGANKPFVLMFWSRDPDATQHNQGDSLQNLAPGINGETSHRALRNADHCLKQLLDWLDAHPAIKANTDVLITSDHGFATASRREIAADGTLTGEPSAALTYELSGKEKLEPSGTLPTGFLAVDLAVRMHMRLFDPAVRSATGDSVYQELAVGGEKSQHPSNSSGMLGDHIYRVDGSDAKLIVVGNAGSDLVYVPDKDLERIHETIATLTQLDYVGGIFVDDSFCPAAKDCPGALPMSAVGLIGSSAVPRPQIAVTYKYFYQRPDDLLSAVQVSDTTLQEGQGQHGGFARAETLNNMAAIGPDFKAGFADMLPMGNIDIVPTLAHILGIEIPAVGTLKGRVLVEALRGAKPSGQAATKTLIAAPTPNGTATRLEYQQFNGVTYYDRACIVQGVTQACN